MGGFKEGGIFGWPSVSNFYFNKESSGGGVLIDRGAHILDLILWWLGDYAQVDYYDDSFGGVEANCEVKMKMESGAEGLVKMSRLVPMDKIIRIEGESGYLEFTPSDFHSLKLYLNEANTTLNLNAQHNGDGNLNDYFKQQIHDFLSLIQDNRQPLITVEEARKCVELIERCYKKAQRLNMPWLKNV